MLPPPGSRSLRVSRPGPAASRLIAAAILTLGVSILAAAGEGLADVTPDSISVEECAARARSAAPAVRAAQEDRAASSWDSLAVARNRRPAYSLGADALIAPHGFYDPTVTNLGQYDLKVGAAWPILDGGSRARDRTRGALGAQSATVDLDLARRDAAVAAAIAALDIVRLRELDAAGVEAAEWLEGLGALITAGVRAGTRSRGDGLRVNLEQDVVSSFLIRTRTLSTARGRELAALLGQASGAAPAVRDPSSEIDREPTAADSLALVNATGRAPEVRAASVAAAQRGLSLLDAQHKNSPRIDLAVDAGLSGADLTTLVPPDIKAEDPSADFGDRLRRDLGASLFLTLHVPILDASSAPGSEGRRAGARAAGVRLETAKEEQTRLSLDLLSQWRAASEQLRAAETAVGRAMDHVLRSKSLYAAGSLTLMELLDARRVYDDARQRLSDARFETRVARFEVEVRR